MFMVLIGSTQDEYWRSALGEAVAPLGKLDVISPEEALNGAIDLRYEIVTVDATYVKDVDEIVSALRTRQPKRRIVVLTAMPDWKRARAAFEAGAIDYLPKTLTKSELRDSFTEIRKKQPPPWPR